jgi:hypothetical protein
VSGSGDAPVLASSHDGRTFVFGPGGVTLGLPGDLIVLVPMAPGSSWGRSWTSLPRPEPAATTTRVEC